MKAYDTNHLTYLTSIKVLDNKDLKEKQFLVTFGFFYRNPKSGIDPGKEQWITWNLNTREVDNTIKIEKPNLPHTQAPANWKYRVPAYFQQKIFKAFREAWERSSGSSFTFDKPITKQDLRQVFDLLFDNYATPYEQQWKEQYWPRSPMLLWHKCPECQHEVCYPIDAAREKNYFECACGQRFLCEFVTPIHLSDERGPCWITRANQWE